MSNDAKLGLVLGVAIVLMIALVFFRNDTLNARMPADTTRPMTALKTDPSPPDTDITRPGDTDRSVRR